MALATLVDLQTAADHCHLAVERLTEWVASGYAPHYFIDGKGPMFRKGEISRWVMKNLVIYHPGIPIPKQIAVTGPVAQELPPAAIAGIESLCLLRTGGMLSGIYFLCKDQDVVYVGQSAAVLNRIATHITEQVKDFDHDRVFFLPCPKHSLHLVERQYIKLLKPRYNNSGLGFDRDVSGGSDEVIVIEVLAEADRPPRRWTPSRPVHD